MTGQSATPRHPQRVQTALYVSYDINTAHTSLDFDLHQRNSRDRLYADNMELTLAHLRVLLAAIFVIAGSMLAGAAPFAGAVAATSGETDLTGDYSALASPGIDHETVASPVDGHACDQNGCNQDCRANCIGSAASGCCVLAISCAGNSVLNLAAVSASGIARIGFLASGIDPEALLRPPQSHV